MASTLITQGITVEGEISSDEEVVIQGTVRGKLSAKDAVAIPSANRHPQYRQGLAWASTAMLFSGNVERAAFFIDEAFAIREPNDQLDDVFVHATAATIAMFQGDLERSLAEAARVSDIARAFGDDNALNQACINLASAYAFQGDIGASMVAAREAEAAARRSGSISGLAQALINYGWAAREADPEQALAALEEGREASARVGNPMALGFAYANAAILHARGQDLPAAQANARHGIDAALRRGDRQQLCHVFLFVALALVAAGRSDTAGVLAGAARSMMPTVVDLSPDARSLREQLLRLLGEAELDRLAARGAAMDDAAVIEFAFSAIDEAFGAG